MTLPNPVSLDCPLRCISLFISVVVSQLPYACKWILLLGQLKVNVPGTLLLFVCIYKG